jgi:succinyl-CoA synthetase beta subunit
MNCHEYQAKQLLEHYGIPVPPGLAAHDGVEVQSALDSFPTGTPLVVKAQIHAGGRGKGHFTDGYAGGVKLARSKDEARQIAAAMLGNTLVTQQTGPQGRKVRTLYVCQAVDIAKEYYLALVLDRDSGRPVLMASTQGGVDIETVAEHFPEVLIRMPLDPVLGLQDYQARELTFGLDMPTELLKPMTRLLHGLYRLFHEKDCNLVEINPLVLTPEGQLMALDAKISFDDNALFRHPDIRELRDLNEEDPKEIEASQSNLSYIALDGNIACMVNGAGLAMATMDIIQHYGGRPANFLDVGGGASEAQVTAAFRIILSDPHVKGILVNIFGGIMKCDIIAKGILQAAQSVSLQVPLVVRLEGTNVEAGKALLASSGLAITAADSLDQAAQAIVQLTQTL